MKMLSEFVVDQRIKWVSTFVNCINITLAYCARTSKLIKFRYAKYDAALFLCNILHVNSWLTLENLEVNSELTQEVIL